MSQFNLETPSITASTTSGTELAADLSAWRTALHTSHSGSSAPSYVAAGMLWYDTTNDQLKIYDGAQSIVVASVDETNNVAYPAAQNPRFAYPQDAGTANARTLTLSPAITAYLNNDIFTFLSTVTNTSPTVTMNVNGVGAKAIRKSDGSGSDIALGAGDIRDGNFYTLQYSSSLDGMMLLNPSDIAADPPSPCGRAARCAPSSSVPPIPTASLTHRAFRSDWNKRLDHCTAGNGDVGSSSRVNAWNLGMYSEDCHPRRGRVVWSWFAGLQLARRNHDCLHRYWRQRHCARRGRLDLTTHRHQSGVYGDQACLSCRQRDSAVTRIQC